MARIRNVKPEFFRHEGLQDMENQHPGAYIMLTFVGLFTQCDIQGVFPWQPRQLKLDILPFLAFDMAETLELLQGAGFVLVFHAGDGKAYGLIPAFASHQVFSGKERAAGAKYPTPPVSGGSIGTDPEPPRNNTGVVPGRQEVGNRKKEKGRMKKDAFGEGVLAFPPERAERCFEWFWTQRYPKAGGNKKKSREKYLKTVKSLEQAYQLDAALMNYISEVEGDFEGRQWKNPETFLGSWEGYTPDEWPEQWQQIKAELLEKELEDTAGDSLPADGESAAAEVPEGVTDESRQAAQRW